MWAYWLWSDLIWYRKLDYGSDMVIDSTITAEIRDRPVSSLDLRSRDDTGAQGLVQALIQSQPCNNL